MNEPAALSLPEGVSEDDLYDGPGVVHLPSGKASFVAPEPKAADLLKPIVPQNPAPVPLAAPRAPSPPPPAPVPVAPAPEEASYLEAVSLALDILATRLHSLLALIAAVIIWGGVCWSPEFWRIIAAGTFSVFVFLPIVALHWKRELERNDP